MTRFTRLSLFLVFWCLASSCAEPDNTIPRVVSTSPANGDRSVDPDRKTISVTFSEKMTDGNWSWAYSEQDKFPVMTGQPHYTDDFTVNVLPVALEPNKEYEIWINSEKFRNFKDVAGNSSNPFRLSFKTK